MKYSSDYDVIFYVTLRLAFYMVLDLNSLSAVHSSKGERIRKRGGGGGFGVGYRNSKLIKKTKIYKHKKGRSDSRQFSR